MLACGGGAVVISEALLEFCAAAGLSWPAFFGAASLVIGMLRALHSAAERVLMAVVIVKVGAAWCNARMMAIDIANVGAVERSACKMAVRVF